VARRVLHVLPSGDEGGAQSIAISLAEGMQASGETVAIASSDGAAIGRYRGERISLPHAARSAWSVGRLSWALGAAVRRWRPDVVHAHTARIAPAASVATFGNPARALVTVHGVPPENLAVAARALRWSKLPVVVVGPGLTDALASVGISCSLIPNGTAAPPSSADRVALSRELDLTGEGPLVVSVGRLVEQKNHALVIRAIAEVPGATLLVIGDGPLRTELQELATVSGVGERVRFTGYREDARSVLGAADVAVLASRWEGLPRVGLEVLAAGVPLVATDVPGIGDWLDDDCALLVRPNDVGSLAEGIRQVLSDPCVARMRTENGRVIASSLTEEAMVNRYLDFYDTLGRRASR
jgi:glycosyltransferase involved in cell wall biosynthesis